MIRKKIIIFSLLLFLPCYPFFKKKPAAIQQELQVSNRLLVDTVSELAQAIEKKDNPSINSILNLIFAQGIEDKIVTMSREEPHYKKEIQKLIEAKKEERKKAALQAARIQERPKKIPKIKEKVIEGTKMPAPVCKIVAEYAVD